MLNALQDDPHDEGTVTTKTTSALMTSATATMLVLTVSLTIFAGPAFDLAARAAANIEEPSTYIDAVFPGGTP
jgi:multicomponent Na+:H+ antiporter subunit D